MSRWRDARVSERPVGSRAGSQGLLLRLGTVLLLVACGPSAAVSTQPGASSAAPSSGAPSSAAPSGSGELEGWRLAWADEFDEPAGTKPHAKHWGYELGDGRTAGNQGWGNRELQWYTDDAANAATDGQGNLVITARAADPGLDCYYGECRYTSARLLTRDRYLVRFGRIEARLQVPAGVGLWPAFWMLGTDIRLVGWPDSGEIDVMENVGRQPERLYGTLHGPGYSGDHGYGRTIDLPDPLADDFHVYAVEWSAGHIRWLVDGRQYHEATPADVAPNEWVYDHEFFLLLNLAVGGNFGGPVGEETVFPAEYRIDYVRVYEAAPAT